MSFEWLPHDARSVTGDLFKLLGRAWVYAQIQEEFVDRCTEIRWDDEHAAFVVCNSKMFKDGVPTPCAVAISFSGLDELQADSFLALKHLVEVRIRSAAAAMDQGINTQMWREGTIPDELQPART